MKKEYMAPLTEVTEVEMVALLANSVPMPPGYKEDVGINPNEPATPAAREYNFFNQDIWNSW